MNEHICLHLPVEETIATNVMAGVLSGAILSSVANPTDVLKVDIVVYVMM